MRNLIKAEIFKLSKVLNYKILLAFSLVMGLALGMITIRYGTTATGADWFEAIGTGILYNAILISIYTADYVGSEFTNRTFASNVSCGVSRCNIFIAKSVVFFIGVLPLVLIHDLILFFILTIRNGFGMEWSIHTITYLISKILYCVLCNFTMGGLILLMAFIVKNKIEIIGFGIVGIYILSQWNIEARNPIILKILQFTFVYQLDAVISGRRAEQVPFWIVVLSSLVGTGILLFAALFVFQKSDLK